MKQLLAQMALSESSPPSHSRRDVDGTDATSNTLLLGPHIYKASRAMLALRGEPRFRNGVSTPDLVGERILEKFLEQRYDFLHELDGPFALIIYRADTRKALIAIDRMGIERLVWSTHDGILAAGTSAKEVSTLQHKEPILNQQALFDFMLSHMIPAPDTIFRGVQKLLPGTAIEFSDEGVKELNYWKPDFSIGRDAKLEDLQAQTLPLLRRAIENSAPGENTGSFLSGGLDSSTLTGLLADVSDGSAKAFSVGFGVQGFDELSYARLAAKRFGCSHYEYQVTPDDIVRLVPRIAASYDEPFGNSSAVPTLCCAILAAEHGVDHLIAGDGGDEIFGGNERYARQRVFEFYKRIPTPIRKLLLDPIAAKFDSRSSWLPFRKYSSYVEQANILLPERFESWNLIYREGPENVFSTDFLQKIDIDFPLQRMQSVWNSCPSSDLLDRMLWYDWKFTLADNDLRKVSRMCEIAGVRASYPMLDEIFVEHSMKIPSKMKMTGNELRVFFKQVIADFLPTEIINKEKHGFGLPFGQWLKEHYGLQVFVRESLNSLKERNIIHPHFIERVAKEQRDGHASYYGYAIWDLVMMEQWLASHGYH